MITKKMCFILSLSFLIPTHMRPATPEPTTLHLALRFGTALAVCLTHYFKWQEIEAKKEIVHHGSIVHSLKNLTCENEA